MGTVEQGGAAAPGVGQVDAKGGRPLDESVESQLSELDRLERMAKEDIEPAPASAGPVANVNTALMCSQLLRVGFDILAVRRGKHWALREQEADLLGGSLAAVLDKYAPDYEGGPEAALVITVLMIVGPRMAADVKAAEPAKEVETTKQDK